MSVQLAGDAKSRRLAGELKIPDVQLWWPHTHGEPVLYTASLTLCDSEGKAEFSLGALGFRTIELDTAGGDFRIKVNGVPVFCRGACWTPLDPVSLRATPDQCRAAVSQAREAGMNMLRVTGTTVYEEDHFYAACDEIGILVWQDFMFANMDYPSGDEAFMRSVTAEATQQLRRLQPHPCLAILCGNSEAEQQAAMWGAPREQWSSPLFEIALAQLCAAEAPRTPYWPSSAHGGAMPYQADVGTTSYYGVGAYLRPLEDARRADVKFATECLAFANVPSDATIARMPGGLATRVHHPQWKARSPRDLGAGWDFDDVRDHYLQTLFGVDPQKLRYADHERYLALSRVVTGEVMAATFAEWRRPASACGGAMVLFLRDLWAGAGWGVVDDAGSPKACWHYLRRALQPVTVLLTDEGGNGLFVHVINERDHEARFEIELKAWQHGETEIASGSLALTLACSRSAHRARARLARSFRRPDVRLPVRPAALRYGGCDAEGCAGRGDCDSVPFPRRHACVFRCRSGAQCHRNHAGRMHGRSDGGHAQDRIGRSIRHSGFRGGGRVLPHGTRVAGPRCAACPPARRTSWHCARPQRGGGRHDPARVATSR